MNIIVREARPDDAEGIIRIFNPIIKSGKYTAFDTTFSVEEERRFIEGFSPKGIFLVAVNTEDSRVVGFQNVDPYAAYTHAFDHVGVIGTYVELSLRKQGIGKLLFEETFRRAREKGYLKLFTFIRADNDAALSAYLKQGFRIVGKAERQARINGKYIDEIIIEKFL